MGRSVKLLKNYTTEQVKQIIKSNSDPRVRQKLSAILYVNLGKSSHTLAPLLLRYPETNTELGCSF
jgi:hypothetical protein